MKSRMPERARTDPWEPQGSNPLGPPGPEPRQILQKTTTTYLPYVERIIAFKRVTPPEALAKSTAAFYLETEKAGQVRYWQYGLAGNSPNLAKSDPSRFPLPDPSRIPLLT